MTSLLLLFGMFYAACGLVLSLAMNVTSFTSVKLGDSILFPALTWGIFPAFLAVILISISERKRPRSANHEIDEWELVSAGCPTLMKRIFWTCFAYAWVTGMALAILTHEPNLILRCISAFWMTFYALGLAVITAAYLRRRAPQ
ncbi:hypothetical protein JQ596_02540 [Bradyrhizobium manausense]|uniref:hypothetical protein n=1 Tax=Bradyrhizobium TaxID=374 RepID=UPI001BA50D01|nr:MULTISPECIES: hypothetical protein [Bradyrhizobium]MBR0824400.1 hypothetical protein [Bradyrhizobium manausense]UVO26793.1 hypothetical protein KUF59_30145 [Bradyrhizobium arachidis]